MEITFESLGITKEQITERVIDQIARSIMRGTMCDDDPEYECTASSNFEKMMKEVVKKHIEVSINRMAAIHLLPRISYYIENLCLQQTNKWGEKTAEPVSFIQYLISKAEAYIIEPVNQNGKTRSEESCSPWRESTTRIAYLINEHLRRSISEAMIEALSLANKSVRQGLENAVKIALASIQVQVKTDVKTV